MPFRPDLWINSLWDPIAKTTMHVDNKLDGGGYIHINKYHKLYDELKKDPTRIFNIPFYTKIDGKREAIRVSGQYIGTYKEKGNELMYGGLRFSLYDDNLMYMKMIGQRRKLYGVS